jgi:hypothetical protein
MTALRNLAALRQRAGEHGPAIANYAEWSAILAWLGTAPAISNPIDVTTAACELVREGRAIRAKLPMPGLPKFASIGRMSRDCRGATLRIAEQAFLAWRDAGRPCLTPSLISSAYAALNPKEIQ